MSVRLLLAALLLTGTSRMVATTGFTAPVSVVAAVTVVSEDGVRPDLVVVWRGAPGWLAGRRGGSGGGGSGRAFHSSDTFGDVQLDVDLDFTTRVAHVGGHRVALGSNNVVLIDRADERGRSTVARVLSIDGELTGTPEISALIARAPDVVDYIRCDAKRPTPTPLDDAADWCAPLIAEGARIAATPQSEVRGALLRYVHLVQKMDHAGIAALFTPDGEVVNPGRDPIRGPAAIEAFLRQFDAYHVMNEMMLPRTTVVDGDRATQTGTYRQRVRDPDGKVLDVSGTFTLDWVRDAAGVWRIQRAATSPQ
jgi:uncharacterized protein (TIGR02246 family)